MFPNKVAQALGAIGPENSIPLLQESLATDPAAEV
jgi:hypothetical protein